MPTEPIQFDMNGDPIQPTRPSPARTLMDELGAWSPIATVMMNATMATPHTPAITGICYMDGVLNIRTGDSETWLPVAHMIAGQYTVGEDRAHAQRVVADYDRRMRERNALTMTNTEFREAQARLRAGQDRLAAEALAQNPAWANPHTNTAGPSLNPTPRTDNDLPDPDNHPLPTRERLNPEWVETPLIPLNRTRSGRTAAERAADAAAAERRRNERQSDPPHDEPNVEVSDQRGAGSLH